MTEVLEWVPDGVRAVVVLGLRTSPATLASTRSSNRSLERPTSLDSPCPRELVVVRFPTPLPQQRKCEWGRETLTPSKVGESREVGFEEGVGQSE